MTTTPDTPEIPPGERSASSSAPLLPFDARDLVAMRVRPAQFARMCEVSRQAVSDWIKRGVITLDPDGMLDPVRASRQVFERTDPARLRARVFKDVARDLPELRAQVAGLRAEVKALTVERDELAAALETANQVRMHTDEVHRRVDDMLRAVARCFDLFAQAHAGGALPDLLEALQLGHVSRVTYTELAESFDDDDDGVLAAFRILLQHGLLPDADLVGDALALPDADLVGDALALPDADLA